MTTKELIATELFILSFACDKFPIVITDELINKIYAYRQKEIDNCSISKLIKQLESNRTKIKLDW